MLPMISWWLIIQLFALAVLPLAWRLFRRLPSRGYPLAKALGLLLVCYVLWLGAGFRLLANSVGGILFALLLVAGVSAWLGRAGLRRAAPGAAADGEQTALTLLARRPLFAWLRRQLAAHTRHRSALPGDARRLDGLPRLQPRHRRHREADGVRLHQRHARQPLLPAAGPLALRLRHQLLLLRLRHARGAGPAHRRRCPAVGFNLGVALWYALTLIGAFGVVYDLVRLAAIRRHAPALDTDGLSTAEQRETRAPEPVATPRRTGSGAIPSRALPRPAPHNPTLAASVAEPAMSLGWSHEREAAPGYPSLPDVAGRANEEAPPVVATVGMARAIRFGLLGALLTGVMGNLEALVEMAYNHRLVPLQWIQWLDIKGLIDSPPTGGWTGGFWWWWHASRTVHDQLLGRTLEVIDEFPFFSFLLGDLHPHVLALPFVLLAIGLALNLLLQAADLGFAASAPQRRGGRDSSVASWATGFCLRGVVVRPGARLDLSRSGHGHGRARHLHLCAGARRAGLP